MDPKKLLYNSLRYDLASFIAKVQNTLQPSSPYLDNWHIRAMTHKLQKCIKGDCKRLIITLPPRYLKSVSVSVAFVAYVLGLYPEKRIVCASYGADLALKNARECRQIMQEPWYRATFPHTRLSPTKNTEAEFLTTEGGFRYTTSVGGTLTGRGGDIVIVDDVMKADDAMSETKRDAAREWFFNTVYSRLDNKQEGIIIVVMQRLHQDDLVGHLMEKGGWEILNLPAIADFDEIIELENADPHHRKVGEVLHEAREPRTVLDKICAEIGSRRFSSQYLQRPIPDEGEIIKFEWFKRYEGVIIPRRGSRIVQSWDTAIKGGSKNDFSVCTTWMVFNDEYFLLDILRVQLAYPDLKKLVYEHAVKYPLVEVVIEDAGSGSILYDEVSRNLGITMDYVTAIRPDKDKTTRAAAVSVHIEAGKVWLPCEAPWLMAFYRELVQFPGGRHDDQIDSLVQFLRYEAGEKGNTRLVDISGV